MAKLPLFRGSAVAIVTPFDKDGHVDLNKLEQLIERQIAGQSQAIIICGTTGESSTLTDEEHKACIERTVEVVNKRIPVIAGTGSNDTAYAVALSQHAQSAGADGILSVTPYYNKTSQEGLYQHFNAIATNVSIPVILYNVPSRTSVNIKPSTLARLAKLPNINAVKECELHQVMETRYLCQDELNIYTGNDPEVLSCLSLGGIGVISVLSNIVPEDMQKVCTLFFEKKLDEAAELYIRMVPLIEACFCDVNPIPVKTCLNLIGVDVGGLRLPLVPPSNEHTALITRGLTKYGLLRSGVNA